MISQHSSASMQTELHANGYFILRKFLNSAQLEALRSACTAIQEQYGVRQVLQQYPAIQAALPVSAINAVLSALDLSAASTVRSLFFNKNAAHNWLVPWHQDKTICVNTSSVILSEYQKWTHKNGIFHVEPPADILNSMLTWRFALDDSDRDNGALKVIPGSHRAGKLTLEEISQRSAADQSHYCELQAGDVLLIRPLLLHASDKSRLCQQRRILHLEMSAALLPFPLQWAERT